MTLLRWRLRIRWVWDPRDWGWEQRALPSPTQPLCTVWRRGPLLLFRFVPLEAVLAWTPPPRAPRGDPQGLARVQAIAQWCFALAFYQPDLALVEAALASSALDGVEAWPPVAGPPP